MATTQKTNREIVAQQYELFNQGKLEECLAGFTDDIAWVVPEGNPLTRGTFHGPESVMEDVWMPIVEQLGGFEVVVDRLIDGGDTIVMEGAHRVTLPDGETVEVPAVHVIDMADGKAERFVGYEDTALLQQQMG